MTAFNASYLKIEPRELVQYLLRYAEQSERDCVNPQELMTFLKLDFLCFNFARELPDEAKKSIAGGAPRALLSFDDRLIATDDSLDEKRTRFSVLHEIGHYVLPNHEHTLYVCDDAGLSNTTRLVMEREANEFAADLLFLADKFSVEANTRPISARTIKEIATKYKASFEATARRFIQKNFRDCMLVVFKHEEGSCAPDIDAQSIWIVRYCVASPTFKTKYYEKISGTISPEAVAMITAPGHDIADSYRTEINIKNQSGGLNVFQAEFFYNTYNIFCLLTPTE
jgi:Zn-dependent peptidase ImmA (M78 family)